MKKSHAMISGGVVLAALIIGLGFIAVHLVQDLSGVTVGSAWPWILLVVALLIALGFEFVNGFHDTANAVATVIYTHSLEPNIAVVWSGLCNLVGVLTSTGTVAFTVITLLPVELILQVSAGAGFAMVFALLIAAIIWNLSTWWFGLPASSSHTMVGSIIGVGLANQLMNGHSGTSGVDWEQATKVFKVLLISPIVGFGSLPVCCSSCPSGSSSTPLSTKRPRAMRLRRGPFAPCWCSPAPASASSTAPTTAKRAWASSCSSSSAPFPPPTRSTTPSPPATCRNSSLPLSRPGTSSTAMSTRPASWAKTPAPKSPTTSAPSRLQPDTVLALRELVEDLNHEVALYKEFKAVPANQQTNVRNDMYVASEAIRLMQKNHNPAFTASENAALANYKGKVDKATKFIPTWVKVAVALALGMGTMVGWKRIVVTVGEKIGKEHLTYAQGASAELVAMATIFAADNFGLPVSTTHVLSSGVAGTMAANRSGLYSYPPSAHRRRLGLHSSRPRRCSPASSSGSSARLAIERVEDGFRFSTESCKKYRTGREHGAVYFAQGLEGGLLKSGPNLNPKEITRGKLLYEMWS